jgi:hypothetical protein
MPIGTALAYFHKLLCLIYNDDVKVFFNGDAGSEIHLSPTDLASPLPTQVKLEQFVTI